MENIVILGGGNGAHIAIDILERNHEYNIIGIIDSVHKIGSVRFGYPIIGRQENILKLIHEHAIDGGFISIGEIWGRSLIYEQINKLVPKFKFINAIHPSVQIGNNVQLGFGIIAAAGSIINTHAQIGNFVAIYTGAQIEHNCIIKDFASISAGSITGGYVTLGNYSAITLGVVVIDRITIGKNSVIGSGSLVLKNIPDNVLAYGNPCKVIRERKRGEKFLK